MTSQMIPEDFTMIVSSDPLGGARNVSADGSSFEVQLDQAFELPKDAINAQLSVQEATVWWTVPNILTGINDKMYIYGPGAELTVGRADLGFDPVDRFEISGDFLYITNTIGVDPPMPVGVFIVGDRFKVLSGNLGGSSYTIVSIIADGTASKTYIIVPNTDSQADGPNDFARVRDGVAGLFNIVIPQGLYDLAGLNGVVTRLLADAGAQSDPDSLVIFTNDEATQKVLTRFTYPSVYIDFSLPETPREILGYNSAVYGPYALAPIDVLAPNVAAFNQVNYFLIHTDLVTNGLRFNNAYNQTVAQVNIDVEPGSQIVYKPYNPPECDAQPLVGGKRTNIRFYLTDNRQRAVNTNNESWTARIRIKYWKRLPQLEQLR